MERDREQLAWLAGFADGDGYFGSSPSSNGYGRQFVIGQNGHPDLLYRAQAVLGFGRVTGPYFREGRKPNWRFVVSGFEKVQATLAMLWPWLGEDKRRQGIQALRVYTRAVA